MNATQTNDVDVLMRLSLPTFLHIGQMAQCRYQYCLGKELSKDNIIQVNTRDLSQNRNKMIYHTCLAGLEILGLLAIGIAGLNSKE